MTRLLLRAPKDPFEVVTAEEVLERNLIGNNSGNLVFLDAAHKLLSAPGVEIRPDRFRHDRRDADRINAEFDAYVLPLANAFRKTFAVNLERLTGLIERLRIPVVVLGVGAQGTVDYDWRRLAGVEPAVKGFVAAVLDHGPSIGVRGEMTADYLVSLGFRDVEVIGCPSMFLWGPELEVVKRGPAIGRESRIAVTVSPYVGAMGDIIDHHIDAYPDLIYIAQDIGSLELLLWGRAHRDGVKAPGNPVDLDHPLLRDDRTRLYLDPWPWLDELRGRDVVFGTRIHGTIAALLAGTPGIVFAHDSRTLELARYFGIPHRTIREVDGSTDVADLYASADFTLLNEGHAARWATFQAYLARHGLDHAFAHEGAPEAWDARVAATPWPPAVRRASAAGQRGGLRSRVRRARHATRTALRKSRLGATRRRIAARLSGGPGSRS